MKESDLYEPIKEYFSEAGFAIYAEVEVRYCGGRVDVVAFSHPAAVAIELKQSLTFELIDQAVLRKAVFPFVYIAYPKKKTAICGWLYQYFCERGIGVLEVDKGGRVHMILPARYKRPLIRKTDWKSILKPEHQEWVPGGHAGGGYVTNYALTMKGVKNFLWCAKRDSDRGLKSDGGWRTVKEILAHCETHYATPKNSLGKALQEFEGAWCEVKTEGGKRHFRYKE